MAKRSQMGDALFKKVEDIKSSASISEGTLSDMMTPKATPAPVNPTPVKPEPVKPVEVEKPQVATKGVQTRIPIELYMRITSLKVQAAAQKNDELNTIDKIVIASLKMFLNSKGF